MKPRVVDQDIDPSKLECRFLEYIDAGIGIRYIHGKYFNAGLIPQLFGNYFEVAFIPCDEHQVGASLSEFSGCGRADAFRTTSDDDGLVFKDHAEIVLKAQVTFDFFPEGRFPTVDFQYFGTEGRDGHGRIGLHRLIRGDIFRAEIKFAGPALSGLGQTVHSKRQVRQNLVIDDVFKKDGIRIEGVLRQNDAIVTSKGFIVANRSIPATQK